jgi:hypothetical protein
VNGTCQCQQGFKGIDCKTETCSHECLYGVCNEEFKMCECMEGYTGIACQIKICDDCNHGTWNGTACKCEDDWEGEKCTIQKPTSTPTPTPTVTTPTQ